jgi:DNA repair protein RadC
LQRFAAMSAILSPAGGPGACSLCAWPASERPRERLLARGVAGLSDAEVLALVLGAGSRSSGGAVDTGRAVLRRFESLPRLQRCTAGELMRLPGIGEARACALVAAMELGRRAQAPPSRGDPVTRSDQVHALIRGRMSGLRQEVFLVLGLDARNRVVLEEQVAQGSATTVDVHPREVFAPLVREGAAAAIAVHNHPSGDPEPSDDDQRLTDRLCRAGEIIGVPLLDHVVVGQGAYVSFADRGLL